MKKLKIALSLSLIFTLTSCATIMHGGKQDIYLSSHPQGAVVRVNNIATTTPGAITLDRKRSCYVLIFEKEGYESVEVQLRRTIDGWFFGNILIGGIIGIVVDFMTGAAYKITPQDVCIDFEEKDTALLKKNKDIVVFVDMEYLKNKGIKVENLERL